MFLICHSERSEEPRGCFFAPLPSGAPHLPGFGRCGRPPISPLTLSQSRTVSRHDFQLCRPGFALSAPPFPTQSRTVKGQDFSRAIKAQIDGGFSPCAASFSELSVGVGNCLSHRRDGVCVRARLRALRKKAGAPGPWCWGRGNRAQRAAFSNPVTNRIRARLSVVPQESKTMWGFSPCGRENPAHTIAASPL